jgi:hypothetical protein
LKDRVPTYDYDDSDDGSLSEHAGDVFDQDTEDEMSFDIPMTRRSTAIWHSRPSKYTSREDAIEEEREFDKVDISTAIRLRKEAKRLDRLSGLTVRRRNDKDRKLQGRQRIDPDGFDADVE